MGRWWSIAALAAVAAVLAALFALSGRDGEPETRRLLPGLDPDAVQAVEIERPGEPAVRLERRGDGFFIAQPVAEPADPAAARELLGALEMLAYQRRGGDARGLEPPRARVRVAGEEGRAWEIAVGDPVEASDQVWIGRDGEAYLAEGHAVRSIVPELAALRDRRPLRDVAAASGLEIELDGKLLRIDLGGAPRLEVAAGAARADPRASSALVRDLQELEIRPDGAAGDGAAAVAEAPALRVRAEREAGDPLELRVTGACPGGEVAVETHLGAGCARREPLEAIAAAAADPLALVNRHIAGDPNEPVERLAVFRDGRELRLRREGAGYVSGDGHEVEPAAVRRFLRELSALTGQPRMPSGEPAELARLEIEREGATDGAIVVARDAEGLFAAREGEPFAVALDDGALQLVRADRLAFLPRRLISVQQHAIYELTRRRGGSVAEVVRRGELAGDHEVTYPRDAAPRASVIETAQTAIARLSAEAFDAETPAPRHGLTPPRFELEVVADPPPIAGAEPRRIVIAVGAEAPGGGCYARVDRGPVAILHSDACEALAAPLTRH